MKRFFVEDIDESTKSTRITGDEFTHLRKALRLNEGDHVELINGKGLLLWGSIDLVGRDFASVKVEGSTMGSNESPLDIALLQGLLKGDKPEFIIQKATELGLNEIIFYTTERTVPVIKGHRIKDKLARFEKVAKESAKQCGRTVLPRVTIMDFSSALKKRDDALKILLWELKGIGGGSGIKEALRHYKPGRPIAVLIGPEGGLSEDNVREALDYGFIPAGLGPRILRAETAAVTAMSIIQYELGDLKNTR